VSVFIQVKSSSGNDLVLNLNQISHFRPQVPNNGTTATTVVMKGLEPFNIETPFATFKLMVATAGVPVLESL
jgi:hypothetical protein